MSVHPEALEDHDYPILTNITFWQQGEIAEANEIRQTDVIAEFMEAWPNAAILFEDFHLRTLAAELSPVRITAMATYIAQTHFIPPRPVFLQTSSLAMSTVTDSRLKSWGLYKRGQGHARDAERHAIVFLRRASQHNTLRTAAWPNLYEDSRMVAAQ